MPDLEIIYITLSLLFYIVFLLPLIFTGSLSSAHQPDLTAGNFCSHNSGSA